MPTILRSSREKTGAQVLYDQVSGEIAKQDFSETYDFNKARLMRRDPTLALAREMAVAPILYSSWGVEGENEDAKLYLDRYVMPFRKKFLRTAMFGRIDFGWKAYELVFKTVDDDELGKLIVPHKIKPLLNDLTWAKANKLGEFVGLRHYDLYAGNYVDIKATHCLFVNMDDEGVGDYAEPRMLRAEAVYDEWEKANDAAARFDDKIAGAHWVVYYPIGRTEHPDLFDDQTDDDGKVDNALIAKNILNSLKSSGSMALPASVKAEIEELGDDGKASWSIELIEVDSKQADFVQRLKYLDALKARSMNVLERVVFEGQFGTKAESGEHTDTMFLLMELEHESLVDFVNEKLVTNLLDWNFGESQGAELKANPLSDDRKTIFADLLKMLLGDPETKQLYLATLDVDEILEALKIPRLDSAELEESDSAFAKALMALVEKDQTDDEEESESVQGKTGLQLRKGKTGKAKDEETDEETDEEKEDLELAEGCGANAKGGGGFQKGNSCARGKGSKAVYSNQQPRYPRAVENLNGAKIFQNPTEKELIKFLEGLQANYEGDQFKTAELRALSDGRNIWFWDSIKGNHDQIAEALGLDFEKFRYDGGLLKMKSVNNVKYYFSRYRESGSFLPNETFLELSEGCGANAKGGGGFQKGNSCARGKGTKRKDLQGEYWLQDGASTYADGDIGDMNHEAIVIQQVAIELLDELESHEILGGAADIMREFAAGEYGADVYAMREALLNWADQANKDGTLTDDQVDDIEAYIVQETNFTDEQVSIAFGSADDARVYGLEKLGWDRIHGNNIQSYQLTRSKLKSIADGLYEAFGEDVEKQEFDIEDAKTGKFYTNVPWEVIADGDMSALRDSLALAETERNKHLCLVLSDCGANAPGGGGFQKGNTCAKGDSGASAKNSAGGTKTSVTETEAFKNWFKDSEVADADGKPLRVYHSTNAAEDFKEFNTKNLSAHFGTLEAAQDRADQLQDFSENVVGREHRPPRMIPVYLSIQNPVEMPDLASLYQTERGEYLTLEEAEERLDEFYWESEEDQDINRLYPASWESETDFSDWLYRNDYLETDQFWEAQYSKDKAVEFLKENGYDGIVYENAVEAPGSLSYIPFDPEQIKSAIGNKTFDPNNPEITLSEGCGANAKGGGGFRKGNTCAKGGKGKEKVERAPAIDTPEFKAWFKDSKIVDKGQPLQVLHGTTQNFTIFDATRGNPESDFGAGFYFTNQSDDVEFNYAGKGPDLTARMWLEVETRWNAQYYDNKEEFQRKVEEHLGKDWEAMTYEEKRSLIEKEVADEFMSNGGAIIPTYLSVQNPAIIGHGQFGNATILSNEFYQVNPEAGEDDAEFSIQGNLVDFIQAVKSNGQKYEGFAEEVFDEDMQEYLYEETSVELGELVKKMRTSQGLAHAEDYANNRSLVMSTEIIRQSLEDIGFDGIIDQTVYQKFGDANGMRKGMKGIDPDSVHFIVFDPRQIKSAIGNKGGFDPENPDITLAEGCGANAPGGGGFQKGNSCSKGDSTKVKKYRVLGTTEDKVTCEQCGKDHLKKTVALAILDPEGNETGEVKYCGTTCAAKLVLQDNANTPAVKKEASKIKKEAEAADNLAKLNEQDLKSRIDNRIKADQGLANLAFNKSGNSLEGSIGLSKDGKFARVNPEANQYEKTFYDWLIKNGFKKQ